MKNKNVCLMYHQIEYPYKDKFYVNPEKFRAQVNLLLEMKLCGSLIDQKPLGVGVIITFDDGHKSNLEAARYLHKKGVKAVFYVVKDLSLNDSNYLTETDIKEISDMGHIIGVHGKFHEWWTRKSPDLLISEIKETKEWIENITGKTCITCSAPGGRINGKIEKLIRSNIPDMKYIRNSVFWWNIPGQLYVNSVAVTCDTSMERFKKMVGCDTLLYMKEGTKWAVKEIIKKIIYKEF